MTEWLQQRRQSGEPIVDAAIAALCRWESHADSGSPASAVSAAGDSHAPGASSPVVEQKPPVDPSMSWQMRACKAMRKKAELQKSHDELLQRYSSLEARHAMTVQLVTHLTQQITNGTSATSFPAELAADAAED